MKASSYLLPDLTCGQSKLVPPGLMRLYAHALAIVYNKVIMTVPISLMNMSWNIFRFWSALPNASSNYFESAKDLEQRGSRTDTVGPW